jgi:hypothetical protein
VICGALPIGIKLGETRYVQRRTLVS